MKPFLFPAFMLIACAQLAVSWVRPRFLRIREAALRKVAHLRAR